MEFHEPLTSFLAAKQADALQRGTTADMFYPPHLSFTKRAIEIAERDLQPINESQRTQLYMPYNIGRIEQAWHQHRRPYYNIWPAIIPLLLRLDLSKTDSDSIPVPAVPLALRFPVKPQKTQPFPVETSADDPLSFPYENELVHPRSIILSKVNTSSQEKGVCMLLDIGENDEVPAGLLAFANPQKSELWFPCPHIIWRTFRSIPGKTIQESIDELPDVRVTEGVPVTKEYLDKITKLCMAILLIPQDESTLLEPSLLSKDRTGNMTKEEWDAKAARAFRRRGPGWDLGRKYHRRDHTSFVVPPHPQRYHVGPGRTRTVIVVRKGYVAHRDQVTKIPTGHLDDERTENE